MVVAQFTLLTISFHFVVRLGVGVTHQSEAPMTLSETSLPSGKFLAFAFLNSVWVL